MSEQSRKMTPPKKPEDKRKPLGTLGPTPLRMITTYMLNSSARKKFREETKEYEEKKASYDEAIRRMNTKQKQGKAKTTTTDIRKQAMKEARGKYNKGKSLLSRPKKGGE
jgi:hypothetical protein